MDYVLGIDIGGTSIKAGLFTTQGVLKKIKKIKTVEIVSDVAYQMVCSGLAELLDAENISVTDIIAIGLTVPGPVNSEGVVGLLPNITLDAEGLKRALLQFFDGASLAFVNDANAAALGEVWQGGAKGVSHCVMITLGTGVGGGVIVNGELVAGAFGAAGEIGHLTMNTAETQSCGCGRKGCLEQYASATGIVRTYLDLCKKYKKTPAHIDHPTDTLSVFEAVEKGDELAAKAIDTMSEYLGRALAQISCVVDPEVVLIGGGVAGAFNVYADKIRTSFRDHCFLASAPLRISAATLGNEAGMYGAAFCALKKRNKENQ